MFKLLNKKKNNKGFTLVELVIVVAILAILVGILAPQYTKYVEKSRKAADASNVENLVTVLKTAASDSTDTLATGAYTIAITADGTTVSGPTNSNVDDVLNEFAGDNWANTTLKSTRWTSTVGDGTKGIGATVTIADDGKVTVEYNPTDLAK